MSFEKIGVVAGTSEDATKALATLSKRYDLINLDKISIKKAKPDVIIALGGDGFMLHTLHRFAKDGVPIYGMNCGTIGFLMNDYKTAKLKDRLDAAKPNPISPLRMKALDENGKKHELIAFNEVSLLRKTKQAAKIKITIDKQVRMEEIICDGVLVATPAGSSAYNASVGGPIIPLGVWLLALTAISPFRPRRWNGALLQDRAKIKFDIKYAKKRPVNAVADYNEIENVKSVQISKDLDTVVTLLFDPDHGLEERILKEQFTE
jgi:NAD+ kinase